MGFSLYFTNFADGDVADADRDGIAEFLAAEGLHVEGESGDGAIFDASGLLLEFDGSRTDLYLDPLDQPGPVSGGIFHATLTPSECTFIYRLCLAGKLIILNPQGNPSCLVVGRTHNEADVPEPDDTVWVASPTELAHALGARFDDFQNWLAKVRSAGGSGPKNRWYGLADQI